MTLLDRVSLQTADYVVISLMLIIPLGIGVFFAIRDAKRVTRDEYLLGGRHMSMLPVMLSIFVTYQSAISLIGLPSETYHFGPNFFGYYIGIAFSFIIALYTITPLIYPLRITSLYEYLDMRFQSKTVRLTSTALGMLQTFFYLAVALLAPGLALESAAGIPLWLSVIIVGVVGTLYTGMGGMKSVVWADAFQTVVVFVGIFAVIIKSVTEVGGVGKTWDVAKAGGRTNFDHFNPDVRLRHTWYGMLIGGTITWLTNLFSQATCQRISSMKSLGDARKSMLINIPVNIFYGALVIIVGICMYAYLQRVNCDPFQAGIVNNPNQMTPFFVLHALHDLPGFAGVYMSCLFSGALSTLSSGISALAANTMEDLLERPMRKVSEKTATTITKLVVFLYGIAIIVVVYLARNLKGQITQMGLSVFSTFGSAVLGIFLLGSTIPWGNKYGAVAGALSSLAVTMWLAIGAAMWGRPPPPLEHVPTDGCYDYNSTVIEHSLYMLGNSSHANTTSVPLSITTTTHQSPAEALPEVFSPYDISYEWLSTIGVVICLIVGIIVSRITKQWVHQDPDPKLILPCLRKFWGVQVPDVTVLHETNGVAMDDITEKLNQSDH